jgi:hypothetical protein
MLPIQVTFYAFKIQCSLFQSLVYDEFAECVSGFHVIMETVVIYYTGSHHLQRSKVVTLSFHSRSFGIMSSITS